MITQLTLKTQDQDDTAFEITTTDAFMHVPRMSDRIKLGDDLYQVQQIVVEYRDRRDPRLHLLTNITVYLEKL